MSLVKVFGIAERLNPLRERLSTVIHGCIVEVLQLPPGKRSQRFFPLSRENMFYPEGRSDDYTVIEISMMAGRSVETRKRLIRRLFDRIASDVGIRQQDLEICIEEYPACNWGFRGMHGDEVQLNYKIDL